MKIQFHGAEQLRNLARDLRKAGDEGKGLRKDLRRGIRKAAVPMRDGVQRAALAIPAPGGRHSGLRAEIARAVRIQILLSRQPAVRVLVNGSAMPEGKRALPAYMDGGKKRWRHPVFGNRHAWVSQTPHPYFWRGIEPHIKDARAAVLAAVERTVTELNHGKG